MESLLLAVKLLFFAQRGVFERTLPHGLRAAMGTVNYAPDVKNLEVLANGDLRGLELLG
jgi:hypothetical protein